MLYSVLIYDSERHLDAMPKAQLESLIANHEGVQKQLASEGKLGPVVRLMPTSTATTLHRRGEQVILDGPFAETKEQLLGLYIIDCATLEEAHEAARLIGSACNAPTLEVRPIGLYYPADNAAVAAVTDGDFLARGLKNAQAR